MLIILQWKIKERLLTAGAVSITLTSASIEAFQLIKEKSVPKNRRATLENLVYGPCVISCKYYFDI